MNKAKDIQELLKPRYKVIHLFPFHDEGMAVNDILKPLKDGSFYVGNNQWYAPELMDKYPNCFKPLAWYEEREASEMPKFLKTDKSWSKFSVFPVLKYYDENNFVVLDEDDPNQLCTEWFEPATETEYQNYINQKK